LVINTQYFKDNYKVKEFAKEQDQWLTGKLNEHKGQKIIVFQHIPLFLSKLDEDDEYFNIEKNLRQQLLEKLSAAGIYVFLFSAYFIVLSICLFLLKLNLLSIYYFK